MLYHSRIGGGIFGEHEAKTLDQLYDVASRAERAALMADGHLGYIMPIGGVAAYDGQVSVTGVGFDIVVDALGPSGLNNLALPVYFELRAAS